MQLTQPNTKSCAAIGLARCNLLRLGLDSAIKDVRYMSLFRRLLRERPNAAAQKWLDAIDFTTVPLGKLRRELVDWILRVR